MKKIFLSLAFIVIFSAICFAQGNETITITTYYPAPYGVYQELRLFPSGPPVGICDEGELYYDDASTGNPEGLYVCDSGGNWQAVTGFWAQSGTNLYTKDSGIAGTEWNVGIGTTEPGGPLHVARESHFENIFEYAGSDYAFWRPDIVLRRARGSLSSPSRVDKNDDLGTVRFEGHDGSSYIPAVDIRTVVDEDTTAADDMPGRLQFRTRSDGAAGLMQTRMTIKSNGNVGIGTDTPEDKGTGLSGYLDVQDVYLRDAGAWASAMGAGGGTPADWDCDVEQQTILTWGTTLTEWCPVGYKIIDSHCGCEKSGLSYPASKIRHLKQPIGSDFQFGLECIFPDMGNQWLSISILCCGEQP